MKDIPLQELVIDVHHFTSQVIGNLYAKYTLAAIIHIVYYSPIYYNIILSIKLNYFIL